MPLSGLTATTESRVRSALSRPPRAGGSLASRRLRLPLSPPRRGRLRRRLRRRLLRPPLQDRSVATASFRRSRGRRRPARPPGDSALIDFFGNLSVLLVAVRAGDIGRARAAADALELDALVERSAGVDSGGSRRMLEDLVAMLGAAQSRDATKPASLPGTLANDSRPSPLRAASSRATPTPRTRTTAGRPTRR